MAAMAAMAVQQQQQQRGGAAAAAVVAAGGDVKAKTLKDIDWRGKIAVLRADLNVPLDDGGEVADAARLEAAAASVKTILAGGGGVTVLSHLGRPREGEMPAAGAAGPAGASALSLKKVAAAFARVLQQPVRFCESLAAAESGATKLAAPGEVLMMENTRFNAGEKDNAPALARRYAALGDVFVMDAFASAHRAEASVEALARAGLPACMGALMEAELDNISRLTRAIKRPFVGIFGGAKISTKLALLQRMRELCDVLLVGGGMANTLLHATGAPLGASLLQEDMLAAAAALLRDDGGQARGRLLLPCDVVAGRRGAAGRNIALAPLSGAGGAAAADNNTIKADEGVLDIGPETRARWAAQLAGAKTILWNGPVGLFEDPAYAAGTLAVARAAAESPAYSLIGGGDTIAAARAAGALSRFSAVSTGGGALLELLARGTLPGIRCLTA